MPSRAMQGSRVEERFSMPAEMKLGAPTLRVKDLRSALQFYGGAFGLREIAKHPDSEGLEVHELGPGASSEPVVLLKHDPDARPRPSDFAGLYHYAVLVPSRTSLASTYLSIGGKGVPFDGFADHFVSEALYLHDPEENGIEIYADRGRETWLAFKVDSGPDGERALQRFVSLNKPLDFNSLLGALNREERADPSPFSAGARIGHVHLRVTHLERSIGFYHERLGLDIMANLSHIGAAFLSVGGYHHHIGLNTWHSHNGTPHRRGETGLESFSIVVPRRETLEELASSLGVKLLPSEKVFEISDPDGIEIRLRAGDKP